ncbi:hypothetical protein [Streptomyces sp. A012304]|uniref:hypothetical protein n=1 Tax=Streptomyces sp. A012304 TaxID=375446 RepID=UPI0022311251|nr:hypothetical protein [Streptomyces sp. A012304]GKQ40658.1 hypothetical protein ALMP_71810 [Streptomyces sp. A012304]
MEVAPSGIAAEARAALAAAGARVTAPAGAVPVALAVSGAVAAAVAAAGRRAFASRRRPTAARRFPHQATLRPLPDRGRLYPHRPPPHRRHGHGGGAQRQRGPARRAALLDGPHTRSVHELVTAEDAVLRLAGRLARRAERRVRVLAPTDAVRDELTTVFPRPPLPVRPFAVADDGDRLTDAERRRARLAFGIPTAEAAVCLVGG